MSILSIRPQDGGWPLSGNDFHFPLTYFHIPCPAPITAGHEENGGWQQIDKRPTSSPVGFCCDLIVRQKTPCPLDGPPRRAVKQASHPIGCRRVCDSVWGGCGSAGSVPHKVVVGDGLGSNCRGWHPECLVEQSAGRHPSWKGAMPAWPYGFLDESTRPDANLQRFGVAEQVESESAQAIPPLTSPLAGRKDNPKVANHDGPDTRSRPCDGRSGVDVDVVQLASARPFVRSPVRQISLLARTQDGVRRGRHIVRPHGRR